MNEMIERVARAISGAPFPSAKSLAKARAAIEAMREPSETMIEAGNVARVDVHRIKENTLSTWEAMIHAALAEQKPKESGLPAGQQVPTPSV